MFTPERLAGREAHDGRADVARPCLRDSDSTSTQLAVDGSIAAFNPTESLGKNRERSYTAKRFKTVINA
ncbi:hypothetical protein [Pseudomonas syringae]|uniref:hypothetical protein n=1 Tax=Pseudomonas syringae TaxID=317 RepID=UPI0010617A7D|nr:hypothetical protein [Pseudomonas syringae]